MAHRSSTSGIQLRPADLAFLYSQVSGPDPQIRNVSGFDNNLLHPLWGNAEQPFLRLAPAHFEPGTFSGVRVTSVDGVSALPNPRLVSDVIGQQPLDAAGNTISMPNPFGDNLLLMSFGQFFDHGLDFYARGGGPDLVPIGDMNAQLGLAQDRLNDIRANAGLPSVQLDLTDNLLAQLQADPQPFDFLIGSRAGRYDADANGNVVVDANGTPILNNATQNPVFINKTAPFVEQSQTYGSAPEMTYLLRESARDPKTGKLIYENGFDGDPAHIVKTYRLLDGAADVGPDGVARGNLPTYADILVNNGVSRAQIDHLLADVAAGKMTNGEAWTHLETLSGFVDYNDIGDAQHTILLGDKNDFYASPTGQDGSPNPDFSLENLLSYKISGDHRTNENVALTAVHTIWHREANFQAEQIKALHPEWSDEQIFQAAKIVQTAEYQRVVFTEFAPAMSGAIPGSSHGFSGYNPAVNPGISDEFAGAMYRVGHSMINETIPFTDSSGHTQDVPLFSAFLNPAMFDGNDPLTNGVGGAAAIIQGEVGVAHQKIDEQVVEVVRSELLGTPLDLYAANIERGRELGIATLNEFRAYVSANTSLIAQAGQASDYTTRVPGQVPSLTPYTSWADFGNNLRGTPAEQAALLALFKATYGEDDSHVNDVDLFVGGLAEKSYGNSQMGSTFTWIFQEQLDRLQDGDRFYYFNQLHNDPLLIADIGSQHFSDIIMRNTGIEHMHYEAFKVSETLNLGDKERSHDFSTLPADPDHAYVLVGNKFGNTITGTGQDDAIYGDDGNDSINGGLGLDALFGGKGNDTLTAGSDPRGVFAYGEDGNDCINGNIGDDNLIGGDGNDVLRGGAGKDYLSGGSGDDWLMPGAGLNVVDGGDGNDTVDYSDATAGVQVDLSFAGDVAAGSGGYQGDVIAGVENVVGSNFADSITGDSGNNSLSGNGGDDWLDGGAGSDTMAGGAGGDTYVVDDAKDKIIELAGGGIDTVEVTAGSSYTLGDNLENLIYSGDYSGITRFTANGNQLANMVTGGNGNDNIDGRAGNDTLAGLAGDDHLTGGAGADIFVFGPGFGHDTITDFDADPLGGQDFLDLSAFGITAANFSARVHISDVGHDTLITIDGDLAQTIRLTGIDNAGTVTQQDFLLMA